MPNLKIFVDQDAAGDLQDRLSALLPDLRARLCAALGVDLAAAQLAVLPVLGLPDQPAINVEVQILSGPARTPEALRSVAAMLRDTIAAATGAHAAVRIASFDPAAYLALK